MRSLTQEIWVLLLPFKDTSFKLNVLSMVMPSPTPLHPIPYSFSFFSPPPFPPPLDITFTFLHRSICKLFLFCLIAGQQFVPSPRGSSSLYWAAVGVAGRRFFGGFWFSCGCWSWCWASGTVGRLRWGGPKGPSQCGGEADLQQQHQCLAPINGGLKVALSFLPK